MSSVRTPCLAAALPLSLLVACATDGTRFSRHGSGEVWTGAAAQQVERPQQWIPELALLAATPIARHEDHHWSEELASDQSITGARTSRGDAVAVALSLGAAGLAGGRWLDGDEGRSTEVLVESFAATEGLTQVIKYTDRRHRPEGGRTSFPSGHAAYAFGLATFLARSVADEGDGWGADLGYLAYLPAAYAGIDRIEARRHYPSDVTFGAFLGVLLTDLVYDAHYGDARHPGIYRSEDPTAWHLEPELQPDGIALQLVKRF